MVITKVKQEFNNYRLEMSFGELKGFYELTQQGTGALIDEMRANLEWYFKRLPPPGAEPDEGEKKGGDKGEPGDPKVEEPGPGEPDPRHAELPPEAELDDEGPTLASHTELGAEPADQAVEAEKEEADLPDPAMP